MKPVAGKLFYPNFKFTIYSCMQVKRHALEEWVLCCMLHPSLFLAFLKKKNYSEMNIPSIFIIEIDECFSC